MSLLKEVEKSQLRSNLPVFKVGDTIRVYSRIKEGEKERVQYFEGIVIGFHRNGVSTTFKVRKESYGVGVERTYPMHSPLLEKIVVKKKGWLGKKGVADPAEGTPERPVEGTAPTEVAAAPETTESKE